MESNKTLSDYTDIFKEHIKGEEDIKKLAERCFVSVSTIYNYFGGKHSNHHTANAIMIEGIKMLKEKKVTIND